MFYKIFILFAALIFSHTNSSAQENWVVPEDKKAKLSPFEFSDESRQLGLDIYKANCVSCHGDPGKGNYVPLDPSPRDPGAADFQLNTDGEFYHKIREGKGTMPSFKNTLTPEDVWNIVAYLRTFNDTYVQEIAKEIERGAYDGDVSILLNYIKEKNVIEAKVIGTNEKGSETIEGAGISLSAQRMFGDLLLDEPKLTNKDGVALFAVSNKIAGDNLGNVNLIAKLTDQEAFGVIATDTLLAIGIPNTKGSLLEERALWNKVEKAPVWLLMTYFVTVLGVWGTLFFILFQLRRVFFIGKENE